MCSPHAYAVMTSDKARTDIKTENTSASAAIKSATKKALEVTELLEATLVHLDFKTLLLAQRVATSWRDIIQRSSKLQKKLFFEPATLDEAVDLIIHSSNDLVYGGTDYEWTYNKEFATVLNTHVLEQERRNVASEGVGSFASCLFGLPKTVLRYSTSSRRGKASWERMFISQPPFTPEMAFMSPGENIENWENTPPNGVYGRWELDLGWRVPCTLRAIMDMAEESLTIESGCAPVWSESELMRHGWVATYAQYEKHLAALEGGEKIEEGEDSTASEY